MAFTKKEDVVYAIRTYPDETQPVEAEIFIPYTGKVKDVWCLNMNETIQTNHFSRCFISILISKRERCSHGNTAFPWHAQWFFWNSV